MEQGLDNKRDILIGPETLSTPYGAQEPAELDYNQGGLARPYDTTLAMPVARPGARTWAMRIFGVCVLVLIAGIELGLLLRMQSNATHPLLRGGLSSGAAIDDPTPIAPTPFIVVPTPAPPPVPVFDPGGAPAPAPAPAAAPPSHSTSSAPSAPAPAPPHSGKGGKGHKDN